MTLRVVVYARYSSDAQSNASVDDQLRICRARAEREGWTIVDEFHDAAMSGSNLHRPGYQAVLDYLKSGKVDIVLAECLDRFSRDQEHMASLYKHAKFYGVRIFTLFEGDVTELHIGLKGTMAALYLKDLADRTRRGEEGRVLSGQAFGAPSYGYQAVRRLGEDGEPVRGLREIVPAEAAVVRRIFSDFANGVSPLAIARALNAENVAGPSGGPWHAASIRGRPRRGDGILRNRLYIGRLVWNRRRNVIDPDDGRRKHRFNPPEDIRDVAVPALRILEDDLWQQVQDRLAAESVAHAHTALGSGKRKAGFWSRRRPKYLLTGKTYCGACGGNFGPVGGHYLGCLAARSGACRHRRTYTRQRLEHQVLGIFERDLMKPDLVDAFVEAYTAETRRLASRRPWGPTPCVASLPRLKAASAGSSTLSPMGCDTPRYSRSWTTSIGAGSTLRRAWRTR